MEVVPGLIEGFFVDFEFLMSRLHVNALVFVGSTTHHRNELFLPFGLFFHVCVLKEWGSDFIGEHELVELVNYCSNGWLSTQTLKQGFFSSNITES